ncbi:aldehyde dehydrogenase family protein [Streptacidiphilus jiangxiensis]|uniref:Succinate-semialdehyde dehydrogenase / glutarate-semialdehyde dehydrogenase n=1 Tax=Streptacidiphilus jiangxiensis TaxID=235985 RepID=A0A1H7H753_STRJI|nr:aldehyde dehydrogenase family protein [Streptacidiphilus jiangxiensis]SEK45122.1 succinate-semialdehyde dehydrogenase / glutarate-semialdehyde dehydrogenase [Streptacidiphilus jiangxiensis]
MAIATIDPRSGETLATFPPYDDQRVQSCLAKAAEAFDSYRTIPLDHRSRLLRGAADLLAADREAVARTMTTEMGKPVGQARAEVDKCVKAMHWFADRSPDLLADDMPQAEDVADSGAHGVRVRFRPLGVVLAVMPWNFPLWQVIRCAAPALMAGDTVLLKHASNVPQTAQLLQDLFTRADYPDGCFQSLLVSADQVAGVIRDDRVAAVSLTGSESAGRAVAAVAGEQLKKCVLELGGSDPFLVLPSADLAAAVETAVRARVQNNGQSCIAAKRFIVHIDVFEEFESAFVAGMRRLDVGDPFLERTDIGPLATEQGRTEVEAQVDDARDKGAHVLCGGRRPPEQPNGWYYEPTVLTEIDPAMRVHHEEVFGPVATLYRVADLAQAVTAANDTPYGLSSNAWTRDPTEQGVLARELQAGAVYFNGTTVSHPAFPFGGIRRSGYGRELDGLGLREFTNPTTLWYGAT